MRAVRPQPRSLHTCSHSPTKLCRNGDDSAARGCYNCLQTWAIRSIAPLTQAFGLQEDVMKRSWSPLLKVLLATFGLVAAATVGGSGLSAQNQKPSAPKPSYVTTQYPVQVSFDNTTGYAITPDGKGLYTHGVDGVSAYMKVTTQGGAFIDGMFVLEIGTVRNKVIRRINVNYAGANWGGDPPTTCDPDPWANPSGTLSATTVQVLSYIPVMGIKTIAGGGGFWTPTATDAGAVFRFRDPLLSIPGSGNYHDAHCSNLFVIMRDSATQWTVTTDTNAAQYFDWRNNPVSDPVGSTASFESGTSGSFGNYNLRFKMTITCLSALKCSPVGN